MIARLAGVALDARMVARRSEPRDRDSAARWVTANLAAVLGVPTPRTLPWTWRLALRALGVRHDAIARHG